LKKVKENKQPDDQSKQQSSGNYEKYNRGSKSSLISKTAETG
jgi:hypothetical protein